MTTLQTLSTRSNYSANPVLERAQTVGTSASDAPDFAGVLEAFAGTEPDATLESTDETTEATDETIDDSDEASADEETEAGQGSETAEGDAGSSEETGEVVTAADQSTSKSESPERINSAADLASLLTNAASIDLASLATQKLEGKSSAQSQAQPNLKHSGGGETAQAQKPTLLPLPGQSMIAGADRFIHANQSNSPVQSQEPNAGSATTANGAAKPVQTEQAIQQPVNQRAAEAVQPAPATNVQTAQATQIAQTQTLNTQNGARKLESLRSINEIASAAPKARAVTGAESSGKAGSHNAGLDLGSRSPNLSQLTEPKPTQDRALQRQQVMAQVQRGLASIMNTKGGTMKLRMSPEHLGQVHIQLTTKDGHVSVKIDAENDQTRNLLKDGLEGLRSAMESRGVQIDELSIEGRQQSGFQRMLGDPNDTGLSDHGSRNQQDQSRESPDQQSSAGDADDSQTNHNDSDTPRSIWTDLGLDATA